MLHYRRLVAMRVVLVELHYLVPFLEAAPVGEEHYLPDQVGLDSEVDLVVLVVLPIQVRSLLQVGQPTGIFSQCYKAAVAAAKWIQAPLGVEAERLRSVRLEPYRPPPSMLLDFQGEVEEEAVLAEAFC
ncbi:MAG: hypothetical protein QM703_26180 [Gemmatales bacterium]